MARVNFGKIVQKWLGGLNIGGYHMHTYICNTLRGQIKGFCRAIYLI